eukprot:GGOE01009576.1.p4 GENE.GGOE01009576.1~~GGOE01009576.1.p4  ORF type:complete len:120 (-),score=7.60 GGOE01009576.1:387-746(-)
MVRADAAAPPCNVPVAMSPNPSPAKKPRCDLSLDVKNEILHFSEPCLLGTRPSDVAFHLRSNVRVPKAAHLVSPRQSLHDAAVCPSSSTTALFHMCGPLTLLGQCPWHPLPWACAGNVL